MNENIKAKIEELKELVLDMYRSAGDLDRQIQMLEEELEEELEKSSDYEYLETLVWSTYRYRCAFGNTLRCHLDHEEHIGWSHLIRTVQKEKRLSKD